MILDSSALLAVILDEEDEARFTEAMVDAGQLRISAATWVETTIIVDNHRNPMAAVRFDDLMDALRLEIVPITVDIAFRARRAYADFGKGRHPAGLNFGDCFSYALSKIGREPLLFKGSDFSLTDVEPALKD